MPDTPDLTDLLIEEVEMTLRQAESAGDSGKVERLRFELAELRRRRKD